MSERPDDERLSRPRWSVEEQPARRLDSEAGEPLGFLHLPDDRFSEPLLHLVEIGDPLKAVRRHLAERCRAQRRGCLGDRPLQHVAVDAPTCSGDEGGCMHDRSDDVGT